MLGPLQHHRFEIDVRLQMPVRMHHFARPEADEPVEELREILFGLALTYSFVTVIEAKCSPKKLTTSLCCSVCVCM